MSATYELTVSRGTYPERNLRSIVSFHLKSLANGIFVSFEGGLDVCQFVFTQIYIFRRFLICRNVLNKGRWTRWWHYIHDFHLPRIHGIKKLLIFVRIRIGEVCQICNGRLSSPLVSKANRFCTRTSRALLVKLNLLEGRRDLAVFLRYGSAWCNRLCSPFQGLFEGPLRPLSFLLRLTDTALELFLLLCDPSL